MLQDYPYASGVYMAPSVIKRIVADNPSCKMVKHEEWPGLEKLTALKALMANGMRKVAILCGNGGVFLPHELERGADGANTGYAYPEMLVQLVKLIKAGNRAEAHDLFDRHLPLLRYEQQPGMLGLAVRKYILKRRGAIITPPAPASITSFARAPIEAKPGEDAPTTTGSPFARRTT